MEHWARAGSRGRCPRHLARHHRHRESRSAAGIARSAILQHRPGLRDRRTGAPGTGKSTLVDRLAALIARKGNTVGIIAVDPTSPYTGGAILGDRIRMQGHSPANGIFIRSMATRGFLGGLARATAMWRWCWTPRQRQSSLIETVGVGQDEVDIVRLADCTLVVLVPGLGDDVQSMKAGLMEIADIFV